MKEFLNSIIEARSAELNSLKDAVKAETDPTKVTEMYTRAQALDTEIQEARAKLAEITDPKLEREQAEARSEFLGTTVKKTAEPEKADAEQRGKDLKEGRSVTVASSSLVVPSHESANIQETFNEVPESILDGVNFESFTNGDSYEVPYMKGYGEGDYKDEGVDYALAEPTFGYAMIAKTKITSFSEISREALKLPAANYEEKVVKGQRIALRKKLAKQMIQGAGTTGTIIGIFNSTTIEADPLEVSAIDIDTLDDIIFSYGGDEDVEGTATLILNKKDLAEFAKVRRHDGEKAYDIKVEGNHGTINTIPFVLNSACPALSASATTAGTKCMAYGDLKAYTLAEFSPIDVERSDDYNFRKGMVSYRGDVMIGGNVTRHNGFLIVKKKA